MVISNYSLFSVGCWNKMAQSWFVSNRNLISQVWRPGNPKWRCGQIPRIVKTCFLVCKRLSICCVLESLGGKGWESPVGSWIRSLTLTISFHPKSSLPKDIAWGISLCTLGGHKYSVCSRSGWSVPWKTKEQQQQHGKQQIVEVEKQLFPWKDLHMGFQVQTPLL